MDAFYAWFHRRLNSLPDPQNQISPSKLHTTEFNLSITRKVTRTTQTNVQKKNKNDVH
jgi:hypothetical protein